MRNETGESSLIGTGGVKQVERSKDSIFTFIWVYFRFLN